jgi:hypothetical protein
LPKIRALLITKNGENQKIALMEKLLQVSTTFKVKLFERGLEISVEDIVEVESEGVFFFLFHLCPGNSSRSFSGPRIE